MLLFATTALVGLCESLCSVNICLNNEYILDLHFPPFNSGK